MKSLFFTPALSLTTACLARLNPNKPRLNLNETPDGETVQAKIIKQDGVRAYLDTQPHRLTHKQKRIIQREAVTAWADQIGDTFTGLL